MSLLWSSKRLTVASPAEPLLVAAFLGFDAGEELALSTAFAACDALPAQWSTGPAGLADLWVVNGRAARTLGDGALEVDGAAFRASDVRRPVAFTEPLPHTIDARFRFDPGSAGSLAAMIGALGPWLSPRIVQQALVGHLVANAASFTRSTVIHVQDRGRLLAVMNFSGDTGVATDATPAAIRAADWVLRPANAGFMPSLFHHAPTEEVLWRFATRATNVDLLPARYLRLPIHLRRLPTLAAGELSPRQVAMVEEIAAGGRTLRELRARIDAPDPDLQRDLGALYLIGAITCDPARSMSARGTAATLRYSPSAEPSTTTGGSLSGWPTGPGELERPAPTAAHRPPA